MASTFLLMILFWCLVSSSISNQELPTQYGATNTTPNILVSKVDTSHLETNLLKVSKDNTSDAWSTNMTTRSEGMNNETDNNTTYDDSISSDDVYLDAYSSGDYYDYIEEYPDYIIFIAVSIFGTIGNLLIIITWYNVPGANSTTTLLNFLGFADLTFCFSMIFGQTMMSTVTEYTSALAWTFYLVIFVSYVGQFMSIFTTAIVSLTRYISVTFPLEAKIWFTKSTIQTIIVIIVITSFIFAFLASSITCGYLAYVLPAPVGSMWNEYGNGGEPAWDTTSAINRTKVANDGNDNNILHHINSDFSGLVGSQDNINSSSRIDEDATMSESKDQSNNDAESAYGNVMAMLTVCSLTYDAERTLLAISNSMIYAIPWCVVIPLNLLMINKVRKSFKDRQHMRTTDKQNNNMMDVAVIIVTLQSIITYPVFFLVDFLTNEFDWQYYFGVSAPFVVDARTSWHLTSWKDCLQILNSSMNIVVYCTCGSKFRMTLLKNVLKCAQGKSNGDTPTKGKKDIKRGVLTQATLTTSVTPALQSIVSDEKGFDQE